MSSIKIGKISHSFITGHLIDKRLNLFSKEKESIFNDIILKLISNENLIFPRLKKIALKLFQIPASNASAERQFSKAKKILGIHRLSMNPDRVGDNLMIDGKTDIAQLILIQS